jgi:type IV secretion system protein VirB10
MSDRGARLGDDDLPRAESIEHDPRPVVALPRSGLPGIAIAAIAIVAALGLFLILDAQRRRHSAALASADYRAPSGAFAPPPALVVPPEPERASPPPTVTVLTQPAPPLPPVQASPRAPAPSPFVAPVLGPQAPLPSLVPPASERTSKREEPAIVFDDGPDQTETTQSGGSGQASRASRPAGGAGAAGASADDAPARATLIGDKTSIMPTGTTIPAVLETPIDTARPGLLRAVVSQDTRGFDGKRVLVPRGSRLIGEYQADVRPNQHRVLVTWNRLIRPDGVTIRLGSPASDPLGGAGVPGKLHSYFLQRFASAVLQSALTVGVNLASRPGDNSVIVGLPGTTVNNVIGQTPNTGGSALQPKITVKQGAALDVFVARDLDFSGVPSRP